MNHPCQLAASLLLSIALTAMVHAASNGVPSVDPVFGQDAETWWESHPFNPDSPGYEPEIRSPSNEVSLKPGDSIADAIADLPGSGGTIRLAPGAYDGFDIIGRGNLHFLGETGATITGPVRIYGSEAATDYRRFVPLVRVERNTEAVECYQRQPAKNIYFSNLIWDGGGERDVAIRMAAVRDIVWDHCTFRNYRMNSTGMHDGLINANSGQNNIWLRDCHLSGSQRYVVYWDGSYGAGFIRCRIDGRNFKGGVLLLTNDDFSCDYDGNGVLEEREIRQTRYFVAYGNTFSGNTDFNCISATGSDILIKNNLVETPVKTLAFFNPKTSLINPGETYSYFGHRIIGNRLQSAEALVEMNSRADHLPPQQSNKALLGKYEIRDNTVKGTADVVREVGSIAGPNVVKGNSINDPDPQPGTPKKAP